MGHWCLKKSDYMGGGVLSENRLLTFDRYINPLSIVPVSIKILNHNLPVLLSCEIIQSMHKFNLCCVKIKKLFSVFTAYKAVIACQTRLKYAIDN